MYRYELHLHSSACSRCGRQTMEEIVTALKEKHLSGAVITNHFYYGNTAIDKTLPWHDFVMAYQEDYLYGARLAKEAGVKLLFGVEEGISEDRGKEVLIYGVPAAEIAARDELRLSNLPMLSEFVRSQGGVIIQAHPFRDRFYIENPNTQPRAELIDGIEFYNAQNTPEANEKSLLYIKEHPEMIGIVGSDAHVPQNVGDTFIETSQEITDENMLVKVLKERKFTCFWGEEAAARLKE